jgi:sulfopyruvate decarboxylase TPP-binding subunit
MLPDAVSLPMFSGSEIVAVLEALGISHVVWVPDSAVGRWESALESSRQLRLLRVCREGEAWPLAAGLHLGGQMPLVVMQTTGFFESGDALRNVLFDLKLPLYGLIGVRNGLVADSRDSARTFAEPILRAWGIDFAWVRSRDELSLLADHFHSCRQAVRAGMTLLAEGPQ